MVESVAQKKENARRKKEIFDCLIKNGALKTDDVGHLQIHVNGSGGITKIISQFEILKT